VELPSLLGGDPVPDPAEGDHENNRIAEGRFPGVMPDHLDVNGSTTSALLQTDLYQLALPLLAAVDAVEPVSNGTHVCPLEEMGDGSRAEEGLQLSANNSLKVPGISDGQGAPGDGGVVRSVHTEQSSVQPEGPQKVSEVLPALEALGKVVPLVTAKVEGEGGGSTEGVEVVGSEREDGSSTRRRLAEAVEALMRWYKSLPLDVGGGAVGNGTERDGQLSLRYTEPTLKPSGSSLPIEFSPGNIQWGKDSTRSRECSGP